MSSLLDWFEGLEGRRSAVLDSLEEEFGPDAWAALSPASLSSPDFYQAASSPSSGGSPAVAPVQQQASLGSPFPAEGGSPSPGGFTALLSHDPPPQQGFGDMMEDDAEDVLSQYLGSAMGADAMDVDLPDAILGTGYEPLYMPVALPPTYNAAPSPSLENYLRGPARLTDADVQWLTNNQAAAPAPAKSPAYAPSAPAPAGVAPDSTPKPKAVKDMRVEFYRQEIRKQTNGKHTAGKFRVGDVESRSPFFLSFVWREYVNAKYNIRIPPFRDPTTGMVDTRQMLQQKIRSSRTPWKQVDLDKALKEAQTAGDSMQQPGRYRGDIAYYFKRCLWGIPAEDTEGMQECIKDTSLVRTEEGEVAYMESFQPGDIVAVLADGAVTKDTTRKDVALISVVPGNDRSLIGPWKCLPDPPPEPVEEHVLVAVMGIVQIRVTGTVPERADETYVIVPSGRGDGSGVVLPQSEWAASASVQPIVALPLSGKEEEEEGLLLAFRSEQINVPWLQRLEEKTARLESTQEEHSVKIEAISSAVDELQQGGQLPAGDSRTRLELQPRPRLTAHHTNMAASGQVPCKCLAKVLAALEKEGKTLLDELAERGENIVTVNGHPYSPQYAVTRETGERLHIENVALVSVGKSSLAVQPMLSTPPSGEETAGGEREETAVRGEEMRSEKAVELALTEADLALLKEGQYSVRINQECSGCEILLGDRFVLRIVKVTAWKDTIQDIVASSPAAGQESLLPNARMCLREFRGKRRRYIGRGRMAKRIAKGLSGNLPSLDHHNHHNHQHQRHHRHHRGGRWGNNCGERRGDDCDSSDKPERATEREGEETEGPQEKEDPCIKREGSSEGSSPRESCRSGASVWSSTFMAKFMERPAATLLFCRRLVANTWQREKVKLMLFQLSPSEQRAVAERLTAVLMEVTQKEFLCSSVQKKKRTPAAAKAHGVAGKRAARDDLAYIFWAAHVITAWQVLHAADGKGYDIFLTSVALQPLSIASSTLLMCEAIASRPALMKVLDTFLTKDADLVDQCAAMRIYLALCDAPSVCKTLGVELTRAVAFAAELLPAGASEGDLRAAAFCILRSLAADAATRQRLYAHKEIQESILLHGYESDSSPSVRQMGEELRQLMARFPLANLEQGRDIDSNVPFRSKTAKKKGSNCMCLEFSRLDLARVGTTEKLVAALVRLPLLSSTLVSLQRNYFLELQFKPTTAPEGRSKRGATSTAGEPQTDTGEPVSNGSGWTVLWLHDGKLVSCAVAQRNARGFLSSTCRFPAPPARVEVPSNVAGKRLAARINKQGWQDSGLFKASASEGLCVILLAEAPSSAKAKLGLSLHHVEVL